MEELVAVINLDLPVRRPLTVSASGPEYREAVRCLLGESLEYELDSPYFDSFSFSSMGIPALTLHGMWKYLEFYHTDKDDLDAVDWNAVAEAGEYAARIVRKVREKERGFFKYDAWRKELLSMLARAAEFSRPPSSLIDLVKSLEVDERTARVLRSKLIKVVARGGLLAPGIFFTVLAPQFLILDDLEAIERALNSDRETAIETLKELKPPKWIPGEEVLLPHLDLRPVERFVERAEWSVTKEYLAEVKRLAVQWLDRIYDELLREIEGAVQAGDYE
ncbi:MAG TPA: hypothetical protein ENG30_02995 [Thermofilaceae archaeon]|nr:hypothetical protein [Thermofilaceae archaeon]